MKTEMDYTVQNGLVSITNWLARSNYLDTSLGIRGTDPVL